MAINSFCTISEVRTNDLFSGRYISFQTLSNYLQRLPEYFQLSIVGRSVLKNPIYSVEIGSGPQNILIWSQMHGNETTTTKAVLDVLNFIEQSTDRFRDHILTHCRLKIIPVLNPDGAIKYTRENAAGIDLNRDAADQTQPEMQVLQTIAREFAPDFCLNLHDQRSIFGVGQTNRPATLSFLSPASDKERRLSPSRISAMQIIAGINEHLQSSIPGSVGRYNDTFNPNCIGDYFQAQEIPTLLFEAGHTDADYMREKTRKLVVSALCKTLILIGNRDFTHYTPSGYFKIPENKPSFFDVLIKNVNLEGEILDIGIQYEERLLNNTIEFLPKIKKIEKLDGFYGHNQIDANQQSITTFPNNRLVKGNIIKKIGVNNQFFTLSLTNN